MKMLTKFFYYSLYALFCVGIGFIGTGEFRRHEYFQVVLTVLLLLVVAVPFNYFMIDKEKEEKKEGEKK